MSEYRINWLELEQFRSYTHSALSFGTPTFIVGRNASGKSNLLDALELISELAVGPAGPSFDRRGGIGALRYRGVSRGRPPTLSLKVEVTSPTDWGVYGASLRPAKGSRYAVESEIIESHSSGELRSIVRRGTKIRASTNGFEPRLTEEALFLPLASGVEEFSRIVEALANIGIYSIEPLKMKDAQLPEEGRRLRRDGSNSASVVRDMHATKRWSILLEFLQPAVPQVEDVEIKREGAKLSLQFRQRTEGGGTVLLPGFQASDGTLRILGILLALLQRPAPTLVALEEPEAHVHPGAIGVLLDAIKYASAETQVVVTTQSPDLLDAEWLRPEDVRIVEWEGSSSKIKVLDEGTTEVLRRHLRTPGELLRSGAL